VIVVDLPAALWVEKKGYFWLSQVFGVFLFFFWLFFLRCWPFLAVLSVY